MTFEGEVIEGSEDDLCAAISIEYNDDVPCQPPPELGSYMLNSGGVLVSVTLSNDIVDMPHPS